MASSPNQLSLVATQVASVVILLGIATFSVLQFHYWSNLSLKRTSTIFITEQDTLLIAEVGAFSPCDIVPS